MMQFTTRDLSQAVNWLYKHGVSLADCEYAVEHPDAWVPIRVGKTRITKNADGSYTAELESYRP